MALRLVLVGAGHAHLHVLGRARILRDAGIDLHLISPATFLYSGLATGALSGALDLDAGQIDIAARILPSLEAAADMRDGRLAHMLRSLRRKR